MGTDEVRLDNGDHLGEQYDQTLTSGMKHAHYALGELFEGYEFARKEGEVFVFTDGQSEFHVSREAVKSALMQQSNEQEMNALQERLLRQGVIRPRVVLFSYEANSEISYKVVGLDERGDYASLKSDNGESRQVHISQLHRAQTASLHQELKSLETAFWSLPLQSIVQQVVMLHELLAQQRAHWASELGGLSVSWRLKVLLSERILTQLDELDEVSMLCLTQLQKELDLAQIETGVLPVTMIKEIKRAQKLIEGRLTYLQEAEAIELLHVDELIEIFEPEQVKDDIKHSLLKGDSLTLTLHTILDRLHHRLSELSAIQFPTHKQKLQGVNDFVQALFTLQDRYLKTQLRVGRQDIDLIARYQVSWVTERTTYPILNGDEEVTRLERLHLYRELYQHRLLLLFKHHIHDEYIRSLAEYNVIDFYSLFYGIIGD